MRNEEGSRNGFDLLLDIVTARVLIGVLVGWG